MNFANEHAQHESKNTCQGQELGRILVDLPMLLTELSNLDFGWQIDENHDAQQKKKFRFRFPEKGYHLL